MIDGILRIKTTIPPLAAHVVPRPHLLEGFERGLRRTDCFLRALTLVSAPAGYGKTTQVRAWLDGREESTAWYSLDDGDNDPGRFWIHVVSALERFDPKLGIATAQAIRSSRADPDTKQGVGSHLVPLRFDGTHRHVLHFLSDEIFRRRSSAMQDFLLRTSILRRFCASLCDAVLDREGSETPIRELTRDNLFIIRLDEHDVWYRYHALFIDYLHYRLHEVAPETVVELHRRASQWFLSNGRPAEALAHAQSASDTSTVVSILEQHHDEILMNEGPAQLVRSLEELPEECLRDSPFLVLFGALHALNHYGRERALPYVTLAQRISGRSEDEHRRFTAYRSVVMSFYHIYSHDHVEASKCADDALRILPPNDHSWRMRAEIYAGDSRFFVGNPQEAYSHYQEAHRVAATGSNRFLEFTTGLKLATALYQMGRLESAWQMTRDMLETARREGLSRVPRVALLWGLFGELHREHGDLDEAERCIERALILGEQVKPSWGWNGLHKAALCHSRGEPGAVIETIGSIEAIDRELKLPKFVMIGALVWKARALHALGDGAAALKVLTDLGVADDRETPAGLERGALVLARIIASADDVRDRLEEIETRARTGGDLRLVLETLLFRARLEHDASNRAEAERLLREAVRSGRPAGFYQSFIDEGFDPAVTDRDEANGVPASRTPVAGRPSPAVTNDLVEALSERELEILRLVEQGSSNEDIGEALFISPGTVKWHLSNVFGKLGVSKRTKAVAIARGLGLLS